MFTKLQHNTKEVITITRMIKEQEKFILTMKRRMKVFWANLPLAEALFHLRGVSAGDVPG